MTNLIDFALLICCFLLGYLGSNMLRNYLIKRREKE